ncbi:MAG: hypothetical protein GXP54_13985 [Deltaproteobacteria bacterium]|nr:hypothetical protein [Deltaproteobacteria bacterium]
MSRVFASTLLAALMFPALLLAQDADGGGETLASKLENGVAKYENGEFSIALHSRVQVWAGWVGEDALLSNGDRMQEYGFRLRRVRFGLDGRFGEWLTYGLEMDLFDQERTGGPLYQAWVDFRPSTYFGASIGLVKFPFVYTEARSSARMAHIDRAVGALAMSPSSTAGLLLYTDPWPDHLRISAGIYNGLQRKASFHEGYEGIGISLGNKFERLSVVGRFDLEPLAPIGPDEADIDSAPFRMNIGGGVMYNPGKSIKTLGATGDIHIKAYGFHLLAEAIWDWSKPQKKPTTLNTITDEIQRLTAMASVGYYIKWINLGLAVRTEYINDNLDLANEGDEIVIAGTVSYYAIRNFVKVQVEYQHRLELNGAALDNDSALVGVQVYF